MVLAGASIVAVAALVMGVTALEREDQGAGPGTSPPASEPPPTLEPTESLTITEDGTVVDGALVNGSITVRADNVTIMNTTVRYSGYHSIRVDPGAVGTKVLRSTIECGTERTNGLVFGNYLAEQVRTEGCRNAFMSDADNPADVVDSWIDGKPFEQRGTPTPTSTPTSTPSTTSTAAPTGPRAPVFDGRWPSPSSTGPRIVSTRVTGSMSSSAAGEVISAVTVNGRLTVRHDDVTVRDVTVNGTGSYMIQVVEKDDGTCPTNVRFEYVEVNGAAAAESDVPLYSPSCGYVFDHGYVHNVGRTSRLVKNTTISNSYVFSNRTGTSGAHRGAVGTNGGSNNQVLDNVLLCAGTGCSAAIPMYGDFAPVDGLLVRRNLLATTGGYCAYGGSLDSKPYPEGSDIRFIGNHFSTRLSERCGQYGPITGFENDVRGNQWSGNVWHESGRAIPAPLS